MISGNITLMLLIIANVVDIMLLVLIQKSTNKNQIRKVFSCNIVCLMFCKMGQMAQI